MRTRIGVVLLCLALVLLAAWAWPSGGWFAWVCAALFGSAGLFSLAEARLGWCVARAAGFRTRF
jgi:uncharacterized membrane protein